MAAFFLIKVDKPARSAMEKDDKKTIFHTMGNKSNFKEKLINLPQHAATLKRQTHFASAIGINCN